MVLNFYGFPKANVGVMPECAARVRVCVIWSQPMSTGLRSSMTPFRVPDGFEWETNEFDDPSAIAAYIETNIPL